MGFIILGFILWVAVLMIARGLGFLVQMFASANGYAPTIGNWMENSGEMVFHSLYIVPAYIAFLALVYYGTARVLRRGTDSFLVFLLGLPAMWFATTLLLHLVHNATGVIEVAGEYASPALRVVGFVGVVVMLRKLVAGFSWTFVGNILGFVGEGMLSLLETISAEASKAHAKAQATRRAQAAARETEQTVAEPQVVVERTVVRGRQPAPKYVKARHVNGHTGYIPEDQLRLSIYWKAIRKS